METNGQLKANEKMTGKCQYSELWLMVVATTEKELNFNLGNLEQRKSK